MEIIFLKTNSFEKPILTINSNNLKLIIISEDWFSLILPRFLQGILFFYISNAYLIIKLNL